jgi:hypothetical protein
MPAFELRAPMQVDYLVLADAAAAVEGKHYIHGAGWDRLLAPSFPVTHPLMSVAIRFRIGWTETNQPHEVEPTRMGARSSRRRRGRRAG